MVKRANSRVDYLKKWIKKIPGVQPVLNVKGRLINNQKQISRLSHLLQDKKFVIFPSESGFEQLEPIPLSLASDFIKEYAALFGIIRLRKSTAAAIDSPTWLFLLNSPQALLRIPDSYTDYVSQIRSKTRTVIHKAERCGYDFKEFNWNDHLEEIFEINTSKEIRQNEPMRGWYKEPVKPRQYSEEEARYYKYFGGFKDGKLCAYFHCWSCGKFAIGKHIIGHVDHLPNGVMNGLLAWTVKTCIEQSNLKWITYGSWQESSLGEFKKHAGFQEYAFLINVSDNLKLTNYCLRFNRSIIRI